MAFSFLSTLYAVRLRLEVEVSMISPDERRVQE